MNAQSHIWRLMGVVGVEPASYACTCYIMNEMALTNMHLDLRQQTDRVQGCRLTTVDTDTLQWSTASNLPHPLSSFSHSLWGHSLFSEGPWIPNKVSLHLYIN